VSVSRFWPTGFQYSEQRLSRKRTAKGQNAAAWSVNVTDEAAVKLLINAVAARFGGLRVMVNNARVSGSPEPTDQVTEAEWDKVQTVNVKGVFFGTKHAMPHLRTAGAGSIINLSSIAGLVSVFGATVEAFLRPLIEAGVI